MNKVIATLRGVGVAIGFLSATAVFLPVQWLAVRFDWPLRDRFPVQYARWLCV